MRQSAVVLAEHEPEHREYLERHLRDDGFEVFAAGWPRQALDLAERVAPDVVIAAEPDLCRMLRAGEPGRSWDRNVPVIVLTRSDASAVERVRALESGADDVVERHLYLELRARVRALVRRVRVGQADVLEVGGLTIDRRARQARVGDSLLKLSSREYELAAKLASDPHRVFTKAELLRDVWSVPNGIRTRTVDSHASRLRRKLEAAGLERVVINVWGVGYRLSD
jgi:DNA-binding response OmpR family regulator